MESAEQKEFVRWFRETWPEHAMALRVSLRGMNLGGGKRAAIMVKHMAAQGSVDGEADIAILRPMGGFGSMVIEHKAEGQPHKLTQKQADYLAYHRWIGNLALSTRGIGMLKRMVEGYMTGEFNQGSQNEA